MSGRPRAAGRDYDRAETAVDGGVHVVGLVLGVTGAAVPIGFAARKPGARDLPVSIVYVSGLLAMLGFFGGLQSLAGVTHQMAAAPLRSLGDLSADAATYTPFTVQMKSGLASGLLVGIWTIAAVGIVLKLVLPGRFDRLSLVLYLLLGWSGVMLYDVITSLPSLTIWLLATGVALYSLGVVFHVWESLRFQNAIWHSFVVLAAACHYAAVFGFLGVTT